MIKFIQCIQSPDDHKGDPEWTKLGDDNWPTWERTPWLDARLVVEALTPALYDLHESAVRKSPGADNLSLFIAMMQCQRPYVALVNEAGEFVEVYERRSIVELMTTEMTALLSRAPNEQVGRKRD
jgi:hypothetical protein